MSQELTNTELPENDRFIELAARIDRVTVIIQSVITKVENAIFACKNELSDDSTGPEARNLAEHILSILE